MAKVAAEPDSGIPVMDSLNLPTLQSRHKWQKPVEDLARDTVVLVMDPQLPRAQWPIGQFIRLLSSPDGRIRAARLVQLPSPQRMSHEEFVYGKHSLLRILPVVQRPTRPPDGALPATHH